MLSVGYDLLGLEPDAGWLRVELEGGRREILSGSLGKTTASFGDGTPFTLTAEERTSGWRGGLRFIGGGSSLSFVAEANAEQQQSDVSIGGRLGRHDRLLGSERGAALGRPLTLRAPTP